MITWEEMKERYKEDAETTEVALLDIKHMGHSSQFTKSDHLIKEIRDHGFISNDNLVPIEKALEIGRTIGGDKAIYLLEAISCNLSRFLDRKEPTTKHSHYFKDVSDLDEVDVYRVCDLWEVKDESGAIHHAIKKLLNTGQRGVKSYRKDLEEARDSIQRKLDMMAEDGE